MMIFMWIGVGLLAVVAYVLLVFVKLIFQSKIELSWNIILLPIYLLVGCLVLIVLGMATSFGLFLLGGIIFS